MVTSIVGFTSFGVFLVVPPQLPMTELKAAYPFGQELCAEATPDNTRLFTADGAAIAIFDVSDLPTGESEPLELADPPPLGRFIARVEAPGCSPDALLYYQRPGGARYLFIAGSTMGLWRMDLCDGIFQSPPTPCAPASYHLDFPTDTAIDMAETTTPTGPVRKRCLDVAVVEGNQAPDAEGNPILFAIYSARADTVSPVGASELRAYLLEQDGSMPAYGSVLYFDSATLIGLPGDAKVLRIASDPGDPNAVYVALGTGGLCKVNISGPSFSASLVSGPGCTLSGVEQMRDVAVVRNSLGKLFIYAAMDYGRILEYRIQGAGWRCVQNSVPDPFVNRVAAATNGGTRVLVAAGVQYIPGTRADATPPTRKDGFWSDNCLAYGGIIDPNAPPNGKEELHFYTKETAQASAPLTPLYLSIPYRKFWTSIDVRQFSGDNFRVYASTTEQATEVWKVLANTEGASGASGPGFEPTVEKIAIHKPEGTVQNDGSVSVTNVGLFILGTDAVGDIRGMTQLLRIRAPADPGGVGFEIVQGTDLAEVCDDPPAQNSCGGPPPTPWQLSTVMDGFTVADPTDPTKEFWITGGPTHKRVDATSCADLPDCNADPCDHASRWVEGSPGPQDYPVGWRVTLLNTAPPGGGGPPTADSLAGLWWQVPSEPLMPNDPGRSHAAVYMHAQKDPRLDAFGYPALAHCLRAFSEIGYKIYRFSDIVAATMTTCTGPGERGHGEPLDLEFKQAFVHRDVEIPDGGGEIDRCRPTALGLCESLQDPNTPLRLLFNNRSATYSVIRSLEGGGGPQFDERFITVIAAGFVATGPGNGNPPQSALCVWDDRENPSDPNSPFLYFGRPKLVVFDVTETASPSFADPVLLRVALGPSEKPPAAPADEPWGGHAWGVKTKTYGSGVGARVYAFVADFRGRLVVFDVSADQIYPEPSQPNGPYLPGNPILSEVAVVDFPPDPYDGRRPNCIDVEIDGDYAYCALGRAGVGVVSIVDPLVPAIVDIVDTPGLTMGIALRTDENGHRQAVVGDNQCGVLLLGVPAE